MQQKVLRNLIVWLTPRSIKIKKLNTSFINLFIMVNLSNLQYVHLIKLFTVWPSYFYLLSPPFGLMTLLIHLTQGQILVQTPGVLVPHSCGPQLTSPIRCQDLSTLSMSGPPESPAQVSSSICPPAHIYKTNFIVRYDLRFSHPKVLLD